MLFGLDRLVFSGCVYKCPEKLIELLTLLGKGKDEAVNTVTRLEEFSNKDMYSELDSVIEYVKNQLEKRGIIGYNGLMSDLASDIYHQLKKENRGLHKESSERLSNLEESEREKEKLERDMKNLTKNLTDENESLKSKINSLKQEKEEAESKASKLVGNIATLNNDKNSLIAKLSDKDNEVNGLKNINSDLENSNRNWKIGTAITGAGGIGLGFGLSNKFKNKKENKEKD